jgi:hypothetical protein
MLKGSVGSVGCALENWKSNISLMQNNFIVLAC